MEDLTSVGEIRSGISVDVSFSEFQHEPIDLLRLTRQSESLQERSQSIHEASVLEVQQIDKRMHDRNVFLIAKMTLREYQRVSK